MIRSKNPDIFIDKELSKEEIQDLESMQGRSLSRPQYKEEKIGTLIGFTALDPENDLRKKLILGLWHNLNRLISIEITSMCYNDLRYWANWCNSFERELDDCRKIVKNGVAILSYENLAQFNYIIKNKDDNKKYKQFLLQFSRKLVGAL